MSVPGGRECRNMENAGWRGKLRRAEQRTGHSTRRLVELLSAAVGSSEDVAGREVKMRA
jgi:hypothetical protein